MLRDRRCFPGLRLLPVVVHRDLQLWRSCINWRVRCCCRWRFRRIWRIRWIGRGWWGCRPRSISVKSPSSGLAISSTHLIRNLMCLGTSFFPGVVCVRLKPRTCTSAQSQADCNSLDSGTNGSTDIILSYCNLSLVLAAFMCILSTQRALSNQPCNTCAMYCVRNIFSFKVPSLQLSACWKLKLRGKELWRVNASLTFRSLFM